MSGSALAAMRYLGHLRCSPDDGQGACVAKDLLRATVLLGEPVPAEDLHGLVRAEVGGLGGDQFRHRRFSHQGLAGEALVIKRGGAVGEEGG